MLKVDHDFFKETGFSNWLTQEVSFQFQNKITEIYIDAAKTHNNRDDAYYEFKNILNDCVEYDIDNSLKEEGLQSNFLDLAAHFAKEEIDFEQLFENEMQCHPEIVLVDNDNSAMQM